ncbi:unnamed protein product, partial [Discosporangium mesarthrocarpum]
IGALGAVVCGGGVGGGGGRVLNASCLEGLLNCPELSQHELFSFSVGGPRKGDGFRPLFVCKAVVTRARWSVQGSPLCLRHRPCRRRLPCRMLPCQGNPFTLGGQTTTSSGTTSTSTSSGTILALPKGRRKRSRVPPPPHTQHSQQQKRSAVAPRLQQGGWQGDRRGDYDGSELVNCPFCK